jgi:hypothetical protein
MRKDDVMKLIEAMLKPGLDKYTDPRLRSRYIQGYLTSMLADLATHDSDILRKLVYKYEDQRRQD